VDEHPSRIPQRDRMNGEPKPDFHWLLRGQRAAAGRAARAVALTQRTA